jgi:hypothetical protein
MPAAEDESGPASADCAPDSPDAGEGAAGTQALTANASSMKKTNRRNIARFLLFIVSPFLCRQDLN